MSKLTCKIMGSFLIASAILAGPLEAAPKKPNKLSPLEQCFADTIGSCQDDFEEGSDARKSCIKAAEKFCWENVGDKKSSISKWKKPSHAGSGQVVKKEDGEKRNRRLIIKRPAAHNQKAD